MVIARNITVLVEWSYCYQCPITLDYCQLGSLLIIPHTNPANYSILTIIKTTHWKFPNKQSMCFINNKDIKICLTKVCDLQFDLY